MDDETVGIDESSNTLTETPRRGERSEDWCGPGRVGRANRDDVGRPAMLVGADEKPKHDDGVVEGVAVGWNVSRSSRGER